MSRLIYSVVFLSFIGASAMTRLRLDFAVTMLTERFSARGVRIAKVISTAIVLLFGMTLLWLCALWLDPVGLARAGFDARALAANTFNFIYTERTQTLNWPVWALYMIMPVFALSMVDPQRGQSARGSGVGPAREPGGFPGRRHARRELTCSPASCLHW